MSERICMHCHERTVFEHPKYPGRSRICTQCFLEAMHDLMEEAGALDDDLDATGLPPGAIEMTEPDDADGD